MISSPFDIDQLARQPHPEGVSIMNEQKTRRFLFAGKALLLSLMIGATIGSMVVTMVVTSAPALAGPATAKKTVAPTPTVDSVALLQPLGSSPSAAPPLISVAVNKSLVLKLPEAAARVSVGNAEIVDVLLLNPKEIYLLGKKVGSSNVVFWNKAGRGTVIDVSVGIDTAALQGRLNQLMPGEKDITVSSAAESVVLSGTVTDVFKVDRAVAVAESFAGPKKVVNMLRATAPQQVMLEVKVAEVAKNLIDQLGARFGLNHIASAAGIGWTLAGGFLTDANGAISIVKNGATTSAFTLDAQNKDELIKILAEPNIVAMSGQEGTFLAGGKIFIPVPQGSGASYTVTLEEKEFGVGLRFTPTVLEGGRINLRVTPEVSELNKNGIVIEGGGIGTRMIIPSIATRRASTTVQLNDGQTFAIGGLIKNSVAEEVIAFPMLGELPILGALFRSSQFRQEKTELMFIITPHLVKPLPPDYKLPTDSFVEPNRPEFFLGGKMEGEKPATAGPQGAAPGTETPQKAPVPSSFEMK